MKEQISSLRLILDFISSKKIRRVGNMKWHVTEYDEKIKEKEDCKKLF